MSIKGKQPSGAPEKPKEVLFRVAITRVMYVVASNPDSALEVAKEAEPNDHEMVADIDRATQESIAKDEWIGAFVYGTCADEAAEDACKRLGQ